MIGAVLERPVSLVWLLDPWVTSERNRSGPRQKMCCVMWRCTVSVFDYVGTLLDSIMKSVEAQVGVQPPGLPGWRL